MHTNKRTIISNIPGSVFFSLCLAFGSAACGDEHEHEDDAGHETGTEGTASTETGGTAGTGTAMTDASSETTRGGDSTGASESTGGSESTGSTGSLEIAGDYVELFPGGGEQTHAITDDGWTIDSEFGTSVYHIDSYDNETDTLIAQGDAANDFNPEAWAKFQWAYDAGGGLWYCQVVFDAASADEAQAGPDADPTDPATGGCGGFPWSALMPE